MEIQADLKLSALISYLLGTGVYKEVLKITLGAENKNLD